MGGQDITRPTVAAAEAGTQARQNVVGHQRQGPADHSDFYDLAGELVGTLRALGDLTTVLVGQVGGTATAGCCVTTRAPIRNWIAGAERAANRAWSAISHIGVEDPS